MPRKFLKLINILKTKISLMMRESRIEYRSKICQEFEPFQLYTKKNIEIQSSFFEKRKNLITKTNLVMRKGEIKISIRIG